MFSIEKYYEQANSGDKVDNTQVINYIKSFEHVVLWGASYLGEAVGKRLQEFGVHIDFYWDIRADELVEVNNVKVLMPFECDFDKDKTLVIHCIGNHVIILNLIAELKRNGFNNIIRGDYLYSGILCKFCNGDVLTAERCWTSMHCRPVICERAASIIKKQNNETKAGDRIDLIYIVYVINSICNLSCKYCVQYINNYPHDARYNVPYEQVCKDIDAFLDTIDTAGTISMMGGETFLHPDISKIVEKFATKKNYGFLSVPTNGLHPIKPNQLEGFKDPRVVINFGYYLHVATEQQKENYYKNIELVKSYGIPHTIGLQMPTWTTPSTLYKLDVDEAYMKHKKQNCPMPPRDLQVKNGKVHICDMSLAMHNMGLVDYPQDYLDLSSYPDIEERRNQLRALIDREYYLTCGHCNGCGKDAGTGGIQGVRDVFKP